MTIKDYKTVAYEFIYPIAIILIVLFLMRVSWIKDRPIVSMDWSLYESEGKVDILVSGNETVFNSSFASQMNTDFGQYVTTTEYSSDSALDFDSNVLFPRKNKKQKGGIFLSTPANSTSFNYYALINTQSPYTPFTIPASVTQTFINLRKPTSSVPSKIKVINSPLPVTLF